MPVTRLDAAGREEQTLPASRSFVQYLEVAMRAVLGLLMAGMLAATSSVLAHHSFNATYDATKQVTLSGIVTRVEFRNPHIWVFFDVKDERGVTNWGCEGGAPNQLFRQGW